MSDHSRICSWKIKENWRHRCPLVPSAVPRYEWITNERTPRFIGIGVIVSMIVRKYRLFAFNFGIDTFKFIDPGINWFCMTCPQDVAITPHEYGTI
jgi:hypothetical protein